MRENQYQAGLIRRINRRFRGCLVLKNDSSLRQGILDLTVFFPGGFWAMLEVKASENAPHQPNQDWYVEKISQMSFARYIYPENEEAVLSELEEELQHYWEARIS